MCRNDVHERTALCAVPSSGFRVPGWKTWFGLASRFGSVRSVLRVQMFRWFVEGFELRARNSALETRNSQVDVVRFVPIFPTTLLVLFLAAFAPAQAQAQNKLQWKTNYYSVTGASLGEIHRSMNQARPWKEKEAANLVGYTE